MFCKISIFLAYSMAIYCLSCVYYMIRTRAIGTPFKNSLTKKQIEIKKKSVITRRNIFIEGLLISLIIIIIFRPFNKC